MNIFNNRLELRIWERFQRKNTPDQEATKGKTQEKKACRFQTLLSAFLVKS